MKYKSALKIISLNIIIMQPVSAANSSEDYAAHNQMSIKGLRRRKTEIIQQNIKKGSDWTKEKQIETSCGICCSFIIPVTLCSYVGYQLNNSIGLPLGTLVGTTISQYTVSAFTSWYRPNYEDTMTELRTIGEIIATKQKEKID